MPARRIDRKLPINDPKSRQEIVVVTREVSTTVKLSAETKVILCWRTPVNSVNREKTKNVDYLFQKTMIFCLKVVNVYAHVIFHAKEFQQPRLVTLVEEVPCYDDFSISPSTVIGAQQPFHL